MWLKITRKWSKKKDLFLSRENKNAIQCVLNCRRYKRNLDVPV